MVCFILYVLLLIFKVCLKRRCPLRNYVIIMEYFDLASGLHSEQLRNVSVVIVGVKIFTDRNLYTYYSYILIYYRIE